MTLIRNIVVAVDFSETSDTAVHWAAAIARQFNADLHMVHAFSSYVPYVAYGGGAYVDLHDEIRRDARKQLEEAQKNAEGLGVSVVTHHLSDTPDPALAIKDWANRTNADLIVMGTHGRRGLQHAFLGSIAERTIRTVQCPVLAVKTGSPKEPSFDQITVATDFSDAAAAACAFAASFAEQCGAGLDLVHAIDLPPDFIALAGRDGENLEENARLGSAQKLEQQASVIDRPSLQIGRFAVRGVPEDVIAKHATDSEANIIVIGTRGHTGLSHFLIGSVAERTLRTAPCSILVVHSEAQGSSK